MNKKQWLEKLEVVNNINSEPQWKAISLLTHIFYFLIEWRFDE